MVPGLRVSAGGERDKQRASRSSVLDSLRKKSREAVVLLAEDSAGHSAWVLGMCGQQPEGSIGDKPPGTGIPKRHQAKKKKKD